MEWRDQGIVLGVRAHGETSVLLDLLTATHGRHLGMVQGGRSRRLRPCLQPGNSVDVTWKARVEDQLGTYTVEAKVMRAARIMESAAALYAVNHLCALARLLPERDRHEGLHAQLERILGELDHPLAIAAEIVKFEIVLLGELGFGLDLERCALTGQTDDLAFVSPKSGRAVGRVAGQAYQDRLLRLPVFLRQRSNRVDISDLEDGFRLTGHFFNRHVLQPRNQTFDMGRGAYLQALRSHPDLT